MLKKLCIKNWLYVRNIEWVAENIFPIFPISPKPFSLSHLNPFRVKWGQTLRWDRCRRDYVGYTIVITVKKPG